MATIKSFTDIPQSKKLAEILPLESADMFYDGVQDLYKEKVYNIPINGSSITIRTGHIITEKGIKANLLLPCWSLASLLGVLSKWAECINEAGMAELSYEKVTKWGISMLNCGKIEDCYADNPVDACFNMIIRLNELNLLL